MKTLVVGISGTTCSGKTTVATKLHENIVNSILINQDDYFLNDDDPRHVKIPELNHTNYDILTSLDMKKMYSDILKILESTSESMKNGTKKLENEGTKVLIVNGFLLFNDKKIADLCDLKYFLILTKEPCRERRKNRIYNPPDVPGYFDLVAWPEYIKHKKQIEENELLNKIINYINGTMTKEEIFQRIFKDICKKI